LSVTGTVNYVGPFNLADPSVGLTDCGSAVVNSGKWPFGSVYNGPASFCTVEHIVDVDLYAEYSFSHHLTLHGTVLNVFDKPPPLDMQNLWRRRQRFLRRRAPRCGRGPALLQRRRHILVLSAGSGPGRRGFPRRVTIRGCGPRRPTPCDSRRIRCCVRGLSLCSQP
jgi:hypothetical protein